MCLTKQYCLHSLLILQQAACMLPPFNFNDILLLRENVSGYYRQLNLALACFLCTVRRFLDGYGIFAYILG